MTLWGNITNPYENWGLGVCLEIHADTRDNSRLGEKEEGEEEEEGEGVEEV